MMDLNSENAPNKRNTNPKNYQYAEDRKVQNRKGPPHYFNSPQRPSAPPFDYNSPSLYEESFREFGGRPVRHRAEEYYGNEQNRNYHDFHQYPSYYERRCLSPPPAYDESIQNDSRVTVDDVVGVLSKLDKLTETTENIGRQLLSDPVTILKVVESKGDIFNINRQGKHPVISLDPQVALCLNHLSSEGCSHLDDCRDIHVCRDFISGSCKSKEDCMFGHDWHTNHNDSILSDFHLNNLSESVLLKVMKKSCKYVSTLEICDFYNISGRGCKYGDKCYKLHICKDFILHSCSDSCSFNHNVRQAQCSKVLQDFKIELNESPRDIIMQIKAQLKHTKNGSKASNNNKEKAAGYANPGKGKSDNSQKRPQNSKVNNKRTLRSTDLCGDVEIPKICIHAMDRNCKDFQKGCKYLHAMSKFHWQVKDSGSWYNLPVYLSKELETAFCDVSVSAVDLSCLDEGKLKHSANEYKQILGTGCLKADFETMKMFCSGNKLDIRRMSTPSAAVLKNSEDKATVFEWYFKDEYGNWIKYGQVDSLGKSELVSSISSNDIEDQYVQNPSAISFKNEFFEYNLDFTRMVQINTRTGKKREIRRRPSSMLPKSQSAGKENPKANLPSYWTPMVNDHELVVLDPSSAEYKRVSSRVSQTLPNYNIRRIQRLQNPYLWQPFQSKKASLSQQ